MMPPQLAKAKRPPKGQSRRPILEQLPAVTTTELKISSLYTGKPAAIKPFKIPNIEAVKSSLTAVEFHFASLHRGQRGRSERFKLKPIRTGFGSFRYCFYCNTCATPVERLYYFNHSLLCRFCCNGRYASRAIASKNRPVLAAARLEDFLNRPIWQRTRERLLKRFGPKLMKAQQAYGIKVRSLW